MDLSQPKMKDSLYGEMAWEDVTRCWFSTIENVPNEKFTIQIHTDSPTDFLATRNTHQAYKRIIVDLSDIRRKAVKTLFEDNKNIREKKRKRKYIANLVEKSLKILSISLSQDLSAKIHFDGDRFDEEFIIVIIDKNGEFDEALMTDRY